MKFFPLILLQALLVGCDSSGPSPTPAPTTTKNLVLSTAYPLSDLVRRVGQEGVEVQWLAEGSQRPETLPQDPQLRQRANKVQLVVTSGPWDAWLLAELSADARNTRVLEPEKLVAGLPNVNPKSYAWLDPVVASAVVEALRVRLIVLAPEHEAALKQSAASVREELEALDREIRERLTPFAGRKVMTVRPHWSAFCARYGLANITPIADTREDGLTPGDFREIARAAKEEGVGTLFVDAGTPAPVRQQVAEKTKLRVVTLDPIGTSAPDGLSTYGKLLRHNVAQIELGLR